MHCHCFILHYDMPKRCEGQLFYPWGSWGPQWTSGEALPARSLLPSTLLCLSSLGQSVCGLTPEPGPRRTASYEASIRTSTMLAFAFRWSRVGGHEAWLNHSASVLAQNKKIHSGALIRPNQPGVHRLTATSSGMDTCVLWVKARQSAVTITVLVNISF